MYRRFFNISVTMLMIIFEPREVVSPLALSIRDRVADISMNFAIEPLDEKEDAKISIPQKLADHFCEKFGCEKGEALDGRRDKCERLQREYHRAFQIKHDALLLKIRKETEK